MSDPLILPVQFLAGEAQGRGAVAGAVGEAALERQGVDLFGGQAGITDSYALN
ncbi:MAG: hypothetical protein JXB10_14870 [Pirellulales bacterium]|nr:hypothetical protein [Pirellulales bacterium]